MFVVVDMHDGEIRVFFVVDHDLFVVVDRVVAACCDKSYQQHYARAQLFHYVLDIILANPAIVALNCTQLRLYAPF